MFKVLWLLESNDCKRDDKNLNSMTDKLMQLAPGMFRAYAGKGDSLIPSRLTKKHGKDEAEPFKTENFQKWTQRWIHNMPMMPPANDDGSIDGDGGLIHGTGIEG